MVSHIVSQDLDIHALETVVERVFFGFAQHILVLVGHMNRCLVAIKFLTSGLGSSAMASELGFSSPASTSYTLDLMNGSICQLASLSCPTRCELANIPRLVWAIFAMQ